MMYIPVLGAIIESAGMIIEKRIIRKKNIDYKIYTAYGFLAIVIATIPFLFFFWRLDPRAFQLRNILIFASIVLISLVANLLIFYSLKRESLSELEPVRLMQPLFTILLAFLLSFFMPIYSNEKNPLILIFAIIASIALVVAHTKRNQIAFDKYTSAALLGSFFFSLELVLSKMILSYFSPWTFYFLRCFFIFLIAYLFFHPNLKKIDKQTHYLTWIVSFLWVVYRAILYWGYEYLGIIFTTTLLILTPIFTFIFAKIFLKEKITKKQIVSAVIIVICVLAASSQKYLAGFLKNFL